MKLTDKQLDTYILFLEENECSTIRVLEKMQLDKEFKRLVIGTVNGMPPSGAVLHATSKRLLKRLLDEALFRITNAPMHYDADGYPRHPCTACVAHGCFSPTSSEIH